MKPKNKTCKAIPFIAAVLSIVLNLSKAQAQDGFEPGPQLTSDAPKFRKELRKGLT